MSQADEIAKLGLDPAETPELAESEAERWLDALRSALRPGELAAAEHERLLELALEDPLAPPSEEELIESARLRDALAGAAEHEDGELLAALRAPFAEPDVERALAAVPELASAAAPPPRRRGNVIYAVFGGASVLVAAAAALMLTVGSLSRESAPSASATAPTFVKPHSTSPMFASHFDSNTTARIDLIASARQRDLRDNRYAAWGVR